MSDLQTFFPYMPKGNYRKRHPENKGFQNSSGNSDFVIIINRQSLSPEQIEKSQKKAFDDKFEKLSKIYQLTVSKDVRQFLLKNKFLFSVLKEIPGEVYRYFGDNQKLALKVSYDPDFPQPFELWVLIMTKLSAKEARTKLDKFDKEWWLKNLNRADCKLNIGIEYV